MHEILINYYDGRKEINPVVGIEVNGEEKISIVGEKLVIELINYQIAEINFLVLDTCKLSQKKTVILEKFYY